MEFLRTDFTSEEHLLLRNRDEHRPPSSPEESVSKCSRYRSQGPASGGGRTDSGSAGVNRR